jgi:hypothetical protein
MVEAEFDLLFAGENAVRAARLAPGQGLKAAGFVAPKRKLGKTMLFHVTEFEALE